MSLTNQKLSHQDKLTIAYNGYKRDMVTMIFPGEKAQADYVVRSLAEITETDLAGCDAQDYFDILSIFSGVRIRCMMTHSNDEMIFTMLREKYSKYISDLEKAKRVLTYCRLNMKNNAFVLDSKESVQAFNLTMELLNSTADIPSQNKDAQNANLTDSQYGLVPHKPIYTRGVEGSKQYLCRLRTEKGESLTWERKGCISVDGIHGLVDIYECKLSCGDLYGTIYINMYGTSGSDMAPAGYVISQASQTLSKSAPAQHVGVEINKKKTKKTLVFIVLLVSVMLAAAIFAAVWRTPVSSVSGDIDAISGAPEFYGVQFGMTPDQVSEVVPVKNKTTSKDGETGEQMFYTVERFEMFGIPAYGSACGFMDGKLQYVTVYFSKEDTTLNAIVSKYSEKYGEATQIEGEFYLWEGMNTDIIICDSKELGKDQDQIVLYYSPTLNSKYKYLSYSGPEYDPCDFLNSDIFTQSPERYTFGLIAGEDYNLKKMPYGTSYTFYPTFSFMGIKKNMTTICLEVEAGETTIGLCSYQFLLEQENLVEQFMYIRNSLENALGNPIGCTYTSMYYEKMGIEDISIEEAVEKLKIAEEGIYNIQWEINNHLVTFNLSVESGADMINGCVAISG